MIIIIVIVIAVIAILAAVLIPTFSGVVEKAQKSAVQQEAAAIWKEVYALDLSDGNLDGKDTTAAAANQDLSTYQTATYTVDDDANTFTFEFTKGDYTASFDGTTWTVE